MKIWVSPTHVTLPLGSTVNFLCEVDHDNDYTIEWNFYGQPLPHNSKILYVSELEVNNISYSNTGQYYCFAKSENSWNVAFGYLQVL